MKIIIAVIAFIVVVKIASTQIKKSKIRKQEQESMRIREEQERIRKAEEEKRQKELEEETRKEKADKERKIQKAISSVPGSEAFQLSSAQSVVTVEDLTITQFTPISKKRFVALDLETTGLQEFCEIIEIGAVRVENGTITDRFSQLVNPGVEIPREATKVNKITDDMVFDKPYIYEVLPALLSFIGDDVVAAHNSSFDSGFLCRACMENSFKAPTRYFDTMKLSRYWPEAGNKKLVTLAAAARVINENPHRALGDAEVVAKLILETNKRRSEKPEQKQENEA